MPFRRPDTSDGGATSFDDARVTAEARTGHSLSILDPLWARAWIRIVRGEDAWPTRASREPHVKAAAPAPPATSGASVWSILGITARDVTEEQLKAAYRRRVLETHPDQGGTDVAFQEVLRAYQEANARLKKPRRR